MNTLAINYYNYNVVRSYHASEIAKEVKILLGLIAKAFVSDPIEEKAIREAMEAENLSWYAA